MGSTGGFSWGVSGGTLGCWGTQTRDGEPNEAGVCIDRGPVADGDSVQTGRLGGECQPEWLRKTVY